MGAIGGFAAEHSGLGTHRGVRPAQQRSTVMRKKALASVTAGLMFLAPTLAAPAEARSLWSVGAGFEVGPIAFTLAFGAHGRYRPVYYWRTSQALSYRGVRCSERCFTNRGHHHHFESCPLVRHHLRVHRSSAADLFHSYAPRPVWEGRRYEASSPYGDERSWRDRHDGRHHESRRHDRHQGRRHRHQSSCDHDRRYRSYSP